MVMVALPEVAATPAMTAIAAAAARRRMKKRRPMVGADGCVVCDEFEGGISQKINKREEKIKFQYFLK